MAGITRVAGTALVTGAMAACGVLGAASPAFACNSNKSPYIGALGSSPTYTIPSGSGCDYISAKGTNSDGGSSTYQVHYSKDGGTSFLLGPDTVVTTGGYTHVLDNTATGWEFFLVNVNAAGLPGPASQTVDIAY